MQTIKLYNEHGRRLTRFGAWTSEAQDKARVEVLRATYGSALEAYGDSSILDFYELWVMSGDYQDWLNQESDRFVKWMSEYPHVQARS